MKKKLILLSALGLLASTSVAFAHPSGLYRVGPVFNDGTYGTLTFAIEKSVCPSRDAQGKPLKGALRGSLRLLTFNNIAQATYKFISGNYVEIHQGAEEYYVQTDKNCVPLSPRHEYLASDDHFSGEELVFISR
jgi:hypothetical protein